MKRNKYNNNQATSKANLKEKELQELSDFFEPQPEEEQGNDHRRCRDKFGRSLQSRVQRARREQDRYSENSQQFGEANAEPLLERYFNFVITIAPTLS